MAKHAATTTAPLSPKVPGAVGGGAIGAFVLWLLGVFAFGGSMDAANATNAIAAVPWPIIGVVGPGLVALGGWLPRDLASTLFEQQAATSEQAALLPMEDSNAPAPRGVRIVTPGVMDPKPAGPECGH